MAYYVRKIQRSKWNLLAKDTRDMICNYKADAIANDLRTSSNTLSLWRTEDTSDKVIEPILVINSLLGDNISDIDLIFIPEGLLNEFSLKQADGDTIVTAYRNRHYNVVDLTVKKHLEFAQNVILKVLLEETVDNDLFKKLRFKPQCEMICKWLIGNKINPADLKDRQLKDLCVYLLRKNECDSDETDLAAKLLQIVKERQRSTKVIVKEEQLRNFCDKFKL